MSDLVLNGNLKRGKRGKQVRLIQEWLNLHGFGLVIDGDFGPATDYAVREFQRRKRLEVDGIVGPKTFAELIAPMTAVLAPINPGNKTLGQMIVAYAKQHLKQHPQEVGGQNMGPWVRLYMNGQEGDQWAWCAGFVSYILKQACASLGVRVPITTSPSCDVLACNAKAKGIFLAESKIGDPTTIPPGSIFLNRRTSSDWTHTGILIQAEQNVMQTIEGNTNDEGSNEGYEVCARVRGYKKMDFIIV